MLSLSLSLIVRDEGELERILAEMEEGKIESLLGGKPEGIVVKNYTHFNGRDPNTSKPTMIKLVREEFKETLHSKK